MSLPEPVALSKGWIGIAGVSCPTCGCFNIWQGSGGAAPGQGDGLIYQYYENNLPASAIFFPGPTPAVECRALSYCLAEGRFGSCSLEAQTTTPVCYDNYPEESCFDAGGYFTLNGTCAALNPLCGQGKGACCKDDGTCTLNTTWAQCQGPTGQEGRHELRRRGGLQGHQPVRRDSVRRDAVQRGQCRHELRQRD